MTSIETIRMLWAHNVWADERLLEAIPSHTEAPPDVVREYAHVIGTEETWLSRIEGRSAATEVWPSTSRDQLAALVHATHERVESRLAALDDEDLAASVTYTNSAGRTFTNTIADILLHLFLHGQYHRGKINLLLRRAGHTPAPTDYIAFVRGAPAATRTTSGPGSTAP